MADADDEMPTITSVDAKLTKLKKKVKKMADTTVIDGGGMGGAGMGLGAGLGGGLLGGILGGALLGNRGGLFGGGVGNGFVDGGVGGGVVTPALLAASLAQVTDTAQNTAVIQTLGAIQGAIPLAEGQVQLALANQAASITSQLNTNSVMLSQGQLGINKHISEAIAASLASQNNINVNVLTQGAQTRDAVTSFGVANLTATKDAQFATQVAIGNSTKEILAALNDQNTANLQRQLTVAESQGLENRLFGRQRETEVNVTQTVTQVQAQAQQQQQQQQQLVLMNHLCSLVGSLQNAVATNSNMIIGNTGATTTGAQTANPVNVRT